MDDFALHFQNNWKQLNTVVLADPSYYRFLRCIHSLKIIMKDKNGIVHLELDHWNASHRKVVYDINFYVCAVKCTLKIYTCYIARDCAWYQGVVLHAPVRNAYPARFHSVVCVTLVTHNILIHF